jgi:hypothetical protein
MGVGSDERLLLRLARLLLEPSDKVVAVLLLLQACERHLRARDVLQEQSAGGNCDGGERGRAFFGFSRYSNIVCSSQTMPLFTFAAVYEKSLAWPVWRPKTLEEALGQRRHGTEQVGATYPCKFGPTLLASPSPTVWHCAQRVLNAEAPLAASPEWRCVSIRPAYRSLRAHDAPRTRHSPGANGMVVEEGGGGEGGGGESECGQRHGPRPAPKSARAPIPADPRAPIGVGTFPHPGRRRNLRAGRAPTPRRRACRRSHLPLSRARLHEQDFMSGRCTHVPPLGGLRRWGIA